jgi:hypothetical protein
MIVPPGKARGGKDPKHPLVHHAVVEKVDGKDLYSIDGNLTCQQVARRKRPLSEVAYFYSMVPQEILERARRILR